MNAHERAKHSEVIKDLEPMSTGIKGYVPRSMRLVGSRVNGFGNWEAKLDAIVHFSESTINGIINKIVSGGRFSKGFVVLQGRYSNTSPCVKICHILSGVDAVIRICMDNATYISKMRSQALTKSNSV